MIHARPLKWEGPAVQCDHWDEGWLLLYRVTENGKDQLTPGSNEPSSRILVADELLFGLFLGNGDYHPDISLQRPTEGHGSTGHSLGRYGCHSGLGQICFANSLLRFKCIEQTWVYRIIEYVYDKNGWWGVWPD